MQHQRSSKVMVSSQFPSSWTRRVSPRPGPSTSYSSCRSSDGPVFKPAGIQQPAGIGDHVGLFPAPGPVVEAAVLQHIQVQVGIHAGGVAVQIGADDPAFHVHAGEQHKGDRPARPVPCGPPVCCGRPAPAAARPRPPARRGTTRPPPGGAYSRRDGCKPPAWPRPAGRRRCRRGRRGLPASWAAGGGRETAQPPARRSPAAESAAAPRSRPPRKSEAAGCRQAQGRGGQPFGPPGARRTACRWRTGPPPPQWPSPGAATGRAPALRRSGPPGRAGFPGAASPPPAHRAQAPTGRESRKYTM